MLPFGYFSGVISGCDYGTLEPQPTMTGPSDKKRLDPFPKAPTEECLHNCLNNFGETQSMFRQQMDGLLDKIKRDVSEMNPKRGKGIPESVVTAIFNVCNILKVSDTCKYKACELHDSFMVKMNEDMLKVVNRTQLGVYKVNQLELRTQELAILRIGSCIQLATKTYSYGKAHRHVTVPELNFVLRMFQCQVTDDVIKKSEMRVFALLDYNLNFVTALDVIELVLIQLGLSQLDYRRIYTVAIHSLDHLYLKRQQIVDEFYTITAANSPMIRFDRQKFRVTTEADKFIEGCAIVVTALMLLNMEDHPTYKVMKQLVAERGDLHLVLTLSIAIINSSRKANGDLKGDREVPILNEAPTRPRFYISPSSSRST